MSPTGLLLLSSLNREATKRILIRYGPLLLTGVQAVSSLQTDHRNRQATIAQIQNSEAQKRTAEKLEAELDSLTSEILPREVHIIRDAFNSTAVYRHAFTTAAAVTHLIVVAEGVRELRNIGIQLEGIKEELDRQTLAKVGGWEGGFGKFIHKFVQSEIGANQSSDRKHAFYVYHPDTIWVPEFEYLLEDHPLGLSFGGYSSDLLAVFLLMWANRRTLIETTEDGADVLFHLLVPSDYFGAIGQPFLIHPEIGRLVIKGHVYKGKSLFWFNFQYLPEGVTLQDVGNIANLEETMPMYGKVFVASTTWAFGMGVIGTAFPPLLPITTSLAMWGLYGAGGGACLAAGSAMLDDYTAPILGPPLFQDPERYQPLAPPLNLDGRGSPARNWSVTILYFLLLFPLLFGLVYLLHMEFITIPNLFRVYISG